MSTVLVTVISGVLIYVIGQLILKLIIEPVQKLKITIAKVPHTFIKYAHIFSEPGGLPQEKIIEAYEELRSLASFLTADMSLVPFYSYTSVIFQLPQKKDVRKASKELIGYANTITSESDKRFELLQLRRQTIYDCLNQDMPTEERVPEDMLREAIFGTDT